MWVHYWVGGFISSDGETSNHDIFFWGGPPNSVHEMLNDVFKEAIFNDDHVGTTSMNDDASKRHVYTKDGNQEMYPGCKFTKLGVIIWCCFLLNALRKIIKKAFNMILAFSKELLPNGKETPLE